MLLVINLAGLVGAFIFFMKVKAIKAKGLEESEDAFNDKCEWSGLQSGWPGLKEKIVDLYPNMKDVDFIYSFGGWGYERLCLTDIGLLAEQSHDMLPYEKITRVDWQKINITNTVVPRRDMGMMRIYYINQSGNEDFWRTNIKLEEYTILVDLFAAMCGANATEGGR